VIKIKIPKYVHSRGQGGQGISYLRICNQDISLGSGSASSSPENFVIHSGVSSNFDYLVFLDSRGATINKSGISTTVELLKDYFESKQLSYLIISKPFYLTVIPTLLSFCESVTAIATFGNIITNVGFVDTTPKKKDTLLDLKSQLDYLNIDYVYQYLCNYILSNGDNEELGTMSITETGILDISNRLSRIDSNFFFINSPIVKYNTPFERNRPKCFFPQIIRSNDLVERIAVQTNSCLVDVSSIGIDTYDGVHYTDTGHKKYSNAILSCIY
jgi:hypothetical protein